MTVNEVVRMANIEAEGDVGQCELWVDIDLAQRARTKGRTHPTLGNAVVPLDECLYLRCPVAEAREREFQEEIAAWRRMEREVEELLPNDFHEKVIAALWDGGVTANVAAARLVLRLGYPGEWPGGEQNLELACSVAVQRLELLIDNRRECGGDPGAMERLSVPEEWLEGAAAELRGRLSPEILARLRERRMRWGKGPGDSPPVR